MSTADRDLHIQKKTCSLRGSQEKKSDKKYFYKRTTYCKTPNTQYKKKYFLTETSSNEAKQIYYEEKKETF